MDTAALMGGKEYLVEQVFKDSHRVTYSHSERRCLEWALKFLWHPSLSYADISRLFIDPDGTNHVKGPGDLLSLVVGNNTNRITRKSGVTNQSQGSYYSSLSVDNEG